MRFVHVTGTSGKTTTSHLIHWGLVNAGFSAGLYISPHTTTTSERIIINGKLISAMEFVALTKKIRRLNHRLAPRYGQLYYKEAVFLMALIYFQARRCDWAVIEVGVGGLNDVTNVITNTVLAIVTNVDYDHQKLLGDKLLSIAKHKAGIIKPGSVCLTAEPRQSIRNYLAKVCRRQGVEMIIVDSQPLLNVNERLALTALERILPAGKSAKLKPLRVKVPCRFEIMQKKPTVILDGAHNPAKINFLVKKLTAAKLKNLTIIFGTPVNKPAVKMIRKLWPFARWLIITQPTILFKKYPDSFELAKKITTLKPSLKVEAALDPWRALSYALQHTPSDGVVLITGSLYLTGQLRQRWYPERLIVAKRNSFPNSLSSCSAGAEARSVRGYSRSPLP